MNTNVITFILWVMIGVIHLCEAQLSKPCRWLSYWFAYIALMATLASEIF